MSGDLRKGLLIRALDGKGGVLSLTGRYNEAINLFHQMANYGKYSPLILARAKRTIAEIYQKQGKYDEALKILKEVGEILTGDSESEIIEKATIHIFWGGIYRIKGEMEKAIKKIKTGLNILSAHIHTGVESVVAFRIKKARAGAFSNLASIFLFKGNYKKVIELYQKSAKILEELGDKQGVGTVNGNLGLIYLDKGEYAKAIALFQKHLKISEEIGDKRGMGIASSNLGLVYEQRGEYDNAIQLFQNLLKLSNEMGDKRGIGTASGNLGIVYRDKSEYAKAIKFLLKDFFISKELGDKYGIGIASLNLGFTYLEMGEPKKTKEYLLKSLRIFKELGDRFNILYIYLGLAELEILKSKAIGCYLRHIKKALEYIKKATKLADELNSKSSQATCYFVYGKIYSKKQRTEIGSKKSADLKLAGKNFKKAIEVLAELKQKRTLADAYLEYAKMLKNMEVKKLGGFKVKESSDMYLKKALAIYRELKLLHKLKEIEKMQKVN